MVRCGHMVSPTMAILLNTGKRLVSKGESWMGKGIPQHGVQGGNWLDFVYSID